MGQEKQLEEIIYLTQQICWLSKSLLPLLIAIGPIRLHKSSLFYPCSWLFYIARSSSTVGPPLSWLSNDGGHLQWRWLPVAVPTPMAVASPTTAPSLRSGSRSPQGCGPRMSTTPMHGRGSQAWSGCDSLQWHPPQLLQGRPHRHGLPRRSAACTPERGLWQEDHQR